VLRREYAFIWHQDVADRHPRRVVEGVGSEVGVEREFETDSAWNERESCGSPCHLPALAVDPLDIDTGVPCDTDNNAALLCV